MAGKFKSSRLYYFRYNPKLKDKLPFYDRQPLMFPLNPGTTYTLGINIHWIPGQFRKKFVEWLIDRSLKLKDKKKFARLVYNTVNGNALLRPALKGIRMYINSRATAIQEITKKEAQSFFLPREMNANLLKRHKARKVFKR